MLLCWRGCKQILFDVVVESNQKHRLRRLASFKRLLPKNDAKFLRRGKGMFFAVSFRIINYDFFFNP